MALMTVPWLPTLTVGMFLQPVAAALTFPPLFLYIAEHFDMQEQPRCLPLWLPLLPCLAPALCPKCLAWQATCQLPPGLCHYGRIRWGGVAVCAP